ncbi:HEAT repeat domain-containing protein [Dictyobacter kobayashii]|uniref:HEAT repeat domain-containing protein n=1 Tax=Dictyobacter kobayashii TaxID=2014872 RepID=A0A402AYA6_9CHLR|nr:HEAT repeat domain-containing protein [Dictyobacter kobayashii]GCE24057.1 hypothetical protein KDK_78570 [Dictyobacter kobayashii]
MIEQVPLPLLLEAVQANSSIERMAAVDALARHPDQAAVSALLAALGDSDEFVRQQALFNLFIYHPEALSEVLHEVDEVLAGNAVGPVLGSIERTKMAQLLGSIGQSSPSTILLLTEALHWPHWQVRQAAAQALGNLEGDIPFETFELLLVLCHEDDARSVREAARTAVDILLLRGQVKDVA